MFWPWSFQHRAPSDRPRAPHRLGRAPRRRAPCVCNLEPLEDRLLLSFGTNGMVFTDFGGNDGAADVAIQSDGRIVAAGNSFNNGNDFALARYSADGSLDVTFSGDGKVTTSLSSSDDSADAVALQADGKIIAAGSAVRGQYADFALARYNVDGSPDKSFGNKGKVLTAFFGQSDHGNEVAIQPDGKILVAGGAFNPKTSIWHFALARYNPNGSLDATFDGDGTVTTAVGSGAFDAVIQPDGKIVVVGGGPDLVVARYNPDGSLDPSFDFDGIVTTTVGPQDEWLEGVALQVDGKIVGAGPVEDNQGNYEFVVVRYNPDGSVDPSFDFDGIVTTLIGSSAGARDVAVDASGKIVAPGTYFPSPGAERDWAVARYNSDGSLDGTFGVGGIVTTAIPGNTRGLSLAIQSDGKLVYVGSATPTGPGNDFAVVRYNPDGSLDAGSQAPPAALTAFGDSRFGRANKNILVADQVQSLLAEASGRWQAAGAESRGLSKITVQVADLPGTIPGLASGNTIWLDDNAAGWGWFVEVGQLLGEDHDAEGLMAQTLATGTWLSISGDGDADVSVRHRRAFRSAHGG